MLFSVRKLRIYALLIAHFGDCMRVGAFLTGLIVPREGGLAIAMTEKLEDMVAIIFLPLVCSPESRLTLFFANSTSYSTSLSQVFPPILVC
jgi:hypothetical protein